MKIALLGYGQMGKQVEKCAQARGHEIILRCSTAYPLAQALAQLEQADVCLDFSHPACVMSHLETCIRHGKQLAIGTTGWEKDEPALKELVSRSSIGCLHAPNFSIGMHLFTQIVKEAARLIDPFEEYEIGAFEAHHRKKIDRPSGTAKTLAELIGQEANRFSSVEFSSVRCGHLPGTHTLYFDSPVDTITLSHEARNREGFVEGAVKAAEWLIGKKGFFTLTDLLKTPKFIDLEPSCF